MKQKLIIIKNQLVVILVLCLAFAPPNIRAQDTLDAGKEKSGSLVKFIPDISLITDFSGVYRNLNQSAYDALELPGFTRSGYNLDTLNQKKGFNFNYAEMTMYSAVDPFFDLFAAFHLTEDSFEIEEAFARTLSLPLNLQIKLGKFFSNFGRLNERHPHSWDFSDQPLVYLAFFGSENLKEKGLKLSWLAPVPFYLLLGAEVLTGENEMSFGNADFPGLYVGYIKSSFDIDDLVILLGVSAMRSDPISILAADLTLKWLIDSYRYLSWESEYIYRNRVYSTESIVQNQSGLYTQLVFRFSREWKIGARLDLLQKNSIVINSKKENLPENLPRYSVMIEYSPSEFTRFRLQYSHDRSGYNGGELSVNDQIQLGVNFNIGAHGAHNF